MVLIKADPKQVGNEVMNMSKPKTAQECNFCRADAIKLSPEQVRQELSIVPDWQAEEIDKVVRISRTFSFPNFDKALEFTNRVGRFAESIGHHPDLLTRWGSVMVTWYTHKIGGVQQGDFLCAIETELLYSKMSSN